MSGHSKWHNIKLKKGVTDAKRGKIFTKHAKLIAIAARNGADPEMNSALRAAINNAKADNVPNGNIEKAIKKGSGDDKDSVALSEVMYEGFGPEGVALYIHVITDNKNRAFSNLKTLMAKNGGNLGEAGCVGYLFQKKGVIFAKANGMTKDDAELLAIDSGCTDIFWDDDVMEIVTEPQHLAMVRDRLEKEGFHVQKAELTFDSKDRIKIDNEDAARKILNFLDIVEEDEDVNNVYGNFDIPDEIMKKLV